MHQVAVMIWMPVSVLFEWILLDGLFDIEFISKVPDGGGKLHSKLIHWEDYLLSKHPSACLDPEPDGLFSRARLGGPERPQ